MIRVVVLGKYMKIRYLDPQGYIRAQVRGLHWGPLLGKLPFGVM